MRPRVRVIGVGHPDRGDDAAGLDVLALLGAQVPEDVEVRPGGHDGPALLAMIEDLPHAIVVDCARGQGAPGSIVRLDAASAAQHRSASTSSHGNALAEALALGEALGCLPARLTIFAVIGQHFGIGQAMSAQVRAAMPALAARVLQEATCTKRD